jgi:hypothetical protein
MRYLLRRFRTKSRALHSMFRETRTEIRDANTCGILSEKYITWGILSKTRQAMYYNVTARKQHVLHIYACACVRTWVNACACVCMGVDAQAWACAFAFVALLIQHATRMRLLWLHYIFRHFLINGTNFGKKALNTKCVLIFSIIFIWKISQSKKNSATYCHQCENVFM